MNNLINNEKFKRLFSAIVIGSIIIAAIYSSAVVFSIVMIIVMAAMLKEWTEIVKNINIDLLSGFLLIFVSILSLIIIKLFKCSEAILLWYFSTIWLFDTFSMIGGKFIGGKKIAQKISPNKTISGFVCGLYVSSIFGSIVIKSAGLGCVEDNNLFYLGFLLPTTLISVLALLGDLLESFYKRKYGVKDSGTLIPGHGGFLDRFDSILLSSPMLLLLVVL